MEINTAKPVNGQVQGLGATQKAPPVKREQEDTPENRATQTDEASDDRISLSEASRKAVAELAGSQTPEPVKEDAELSESEAAHLAEQTSEQLALTTASISNQALQKAVDLFT